MRDFLPEEMILREDIIRRLKKIFQKYGFAPLDTPAIEREEVLASKFAGGEEILKEMFTLTDQGERKLGLRYDLTIPFARVIGMNPQLKIPFKRYQIDKVWRDGPIKLGRYREFIQCDCDIYGSRSMMADYECICLANDVFKELKLDVTIKVNNRKILDAIMEYAGIENKDSAILSLDKLAKIGWEGVVKELEEKKISEDSINKLKEIVDIDGNNLDKIKKLKKIIGDNEGIDEIEELFNYIDKSNVVFDVSLARGLSYYTGTVYEVYTEGFSSSLAAGGRYDNMVGEFLEKKEIYPMVGISFGLEPITDVMKKETRKTLTQIYVIPIGETKKALEIVKELRDNEINSEIDIVGRGISKNLDYANSLGIRYVILLGENEVKDNKVTLRDMKSGEEKLISLKEVIKCLKNMES